MYTVHIKYLIGASNSKWSHRDSFSHPSIPIESNKPMDVVVDVCVIFVIGASFNEFPLSISFSLSICSQSVLLSASCCVEYGMRSNRMISLSISIYFPVSRRQLSERIKIQTVFCYFPRGDWPQIAYIP